MRFIAILSLLLVAFAGCSDSGDDEPAETTTQTTTSTTQTTTATETTTTTQTTAPEPEENETQPNQAPVVKFTADVASGQAPLLVNFSFEATDAEGDALTWTLDANGDGESDAEGDESALPGTFAFTFDAGTYEATFTASDTNATSASFTINVTETPSTPAPAPVVFAGSVAGIGLGCLDTTDPAETVPNFLGGGTQDFAIDAALWGSTYTLTPAEVDVTWWLGEELDDPIDAGGNDGTVPDETTSGHVCTDDTVILNTPSTPIDWSLTIQPLA